MEVSKPISKRLTLAIVAGLIIFGVSWRLAPHLPNFAPIGAIALVGSMVLGWRASLVAVFGTMAISDYIIGFYTSMHWTWLGFGLIIALATLAKKLPVAWRIPAGAIGTSLLFFAVSNFGTWLTSGMYSLDLAGLVHCYTMAIPFLRATLLSDITFTAALLGLFEVLAMRRSTNPATLHQLAISP